MEGGSLECMNWFPGFLSKYICSVLIPLEEPGSPPKHENIKV